jgi:peptide deformylase
MIKKAVQIGNPIVRAKSKAVSSKDLESRKFKQLITDLVQSMRHYELVGMAAPQIGVNLRVFVTEVRKTKLRKHLQEHDSLRVFINPKIVAKSQSQTMLYEGCGSVAYAQLFGPVKRPKEVTVTALDERSRSFTLKADGLLAKVIQHEYDHLEGTLCIDKFMDSRKIMHREEYLKK